MTGFDASARLELSDPSGSRAVLIGVSDYRHLDPLPAVDNNLSSLLTLLKDPELWGLADEHCTVLSNPYVVDDVLEAVHLAATEASEALVVYFAGHGLLDDRSDLYLALRDSDDRRLHRAVRYDDVRREMVSTARRCRAKIMILDCCYSGRAMLGGMGAPVDVADQARIDGTYLMTASAETKIALAPPGERYTAFSGALIDTLTEGLADGPGVLGMETLYWHIRSELEAKRYPVPQQRARNDGKDIAIARNRWGRSVRKESSRTSTVSRPPIPDGHATTMHLPPAALVREIEALRAAKQLVRQPPIAS
ncbi:hypothetical protein GCM10011608_59960 [Micromonospora sonchi]|uniref:Peptidase C14 caspase domain-containing protein n=1 Tax=Micromonospora sonchi TaxID=1763543 RepID=A0A917X4W7_9ACTN|nr:caspase family protein [Micromonospora sonchi]GGM66654.1 hypothetical protein GCM10011608_59960 [Micromonospora sonchi]